MQPLTYLVVTSISPPNDVLRSLSEGAVSAGIKFIVVGDEKSPLDFHIDGCQYYDLKSQRALDFRFASVCPKRHYARKNIGYLIALREGAEIIIETDDDNFPRPEFWGSRERRVFSRIQSKSGWVNVYGYFTDSHIWPRGLPLDEIRKPIPRILANGNVNSPIQQALADENPDVDALYRLTLPLPQSFRKERPVSLNRGVWCPFNSQNTTWWREAAPLLYLPSFCSFRMTDIWRSFVAQRIAWENGWQVSFHPPTVWQDRNVHNLMQDFFDEVPGYLYNKAIADRLSSQNLKGGIDNLGSDLLTCYSAMVDGTFISAEELPLIEAWLSDLINISESGSQ